MPGGLIELRGAWVLEGKGIRAAAALTLSFGIMAGAQAADDGAPETRTIPVDPVEEPVQLVAEPIVLPDLVVTSGKREEQVRDITGSVFALGGAALEQMNAREQDDFVKLAPGVSLFKGEPNQNRITIRGIAGDAGTSQTTGILIGEVPFTDPFVADQTPDLSPFDLQTVEILKGPQGTLFGASGLGGALRYVVQPAKPGILETRGFVAYDGVAQGETQPTYGAVLNAPVFGDELALRFVGTQRQRPGVIDETLREEADIDRSRQDSYRALLRYAPGNGLDVQALHLAQDTTVEDQGFVDNLEGRLERSSTPLASPGISDFQLDALTLSYQLGWAELVSATGRVAKRFTTRTDSSRLVPATLVDGSANVDGYTQEFRLVSPAGEGPWQWLVGAFFQRYTSVRRVDLQGETLGTLGVPVPRVPFVPGTVGVSGDDTGLIARYDLDATAQEQAAFLDVGRDLGEHWNLNAGLRAYRIESAGVASASGPLNVVLTGEQLSRNDAGIAESGLNPKLAVEYLPWAHLRLYALASRGFRFGGVSLIGDTPTDDVPGTYRSDHVWLYEGGVRSGWFGNTLLADASVYRIDWRDPQLTQLTDSGLLTYTDNAGGVQVQGADLALEYLMPLRGLALSLAAAYTDARTATPFTAASGTQVPEGARWPYTPEIQSSIAASYEVDLLGWNLRTALLHTHTGKAFSDIENTVPVFDYRTLDARLHLAGAGFLAAPEITLSVTNLLDERGVAGRTDADGVRTIYYERPRTTTLQVMLFF